MQKLYKRTSTGATQVWWQELAGPRYRTHSGQLDGKIVVSEWTTAKPKNVGRANATTSEQQAAKEVESNYTLKRKAGYEDTPTAAQDSTAFQPMLAKNYEDYRELVAGIWGDVWAQPKLDGIRMIANKSGLWSRKGNRIVSCPHIEEQLQPLFDSDSDLILDGEAYTHEYKDDFNAIVSAVKKTKPTAADLEVSRKVGYWIYDLVQPAPFSARAEYLAALLPTTDNYLTPVDTRLVGSQEDLDNLYGEFLTYGYEGQIIRLGGAGYQQKRTNALLKRKEFVDQEFEIVAIHEGEGNRSGMAGYAVLALGGGRTFRANIKGDRAYLRGLLQRAPDLTGQQATVEYFNLTPGGVPRFPRIKAIHETARW